MAKILTGSTLSYGPVLPDPLKIADGSMFFLTSPFSDAANSPTNPGPAVLREPGLYVFSFLQDGDASVVGDQVSQAWKQLSVVDQQFVDRAGDTMTGDLTIQSNGTYKGLRLLNVAGDGAGSIAPGQAPNAGLVISAELGAMSFHTGGVQRMQLSTTGNLQLITVAGTGKVMTDKNGGGGSLFDADLLDGQEGAFYLNAANQTGVVPLARGGTALSTTTPGGIVYGGSGQLGTSAAGTAGQLLQSGGAGAPTWINATAITAGSANQLTTARNITLTGGATGSASFNGTADASIAVTIPGLTNYVAKAGDTMTGILTTVGLLTYTPGSGGANLVRAAAANTGYIDFVSANGNRQGYIGYATTTGATDTGTIPFVMAQANFTGEVVAYASDGRLKENVTIIPNAMEKIATLGGYEYDWKMEESRRLGFTPANKHEHGLIAQEVQKVMPDAVTAAGFNSDYLTVKYERIVALLVAGMNEQQVLINSLIAEVEELKNR